MLVFLNQESITFTIQRAISPQVQVNKTWEQQVLHDLLKKDM